jgi:hypothetical protein
MTSARREQDRSNERRGGSRELNWQFCELNITGEIFVASLLNISSNGLLVLTPQSATTGSQIEVNLIDLKGAPLCVQTRVARQIHGDPLRGRPMPIALGLEVLDKPYEYDLLAASLAYNRIQKTSGRPCPPESTCLRASKRKAFVAACVIEYRGQSHEGILRDVSETGMFVHTDAAIEVQEDAKLWVTERSGATHAMDGRAVRQGRYEHGIGLIPSQGVGFVIQNTPTAFLEMLATL